jgi:hypothetical protein
MADDTSRTCNIHGVIIESLVGKIDKCEKEIDDLMRLSNEKMATRNFWIILSLVLTSWSVCFGGLYMQGVEIQRAVSKISTKVAVIETRVDFISRSQAACVKQQKPKGSN